MPKMPKVPKMTKDDEFVKSPKNVTPVETGVQNLLK